MIVPVSSAVGYLADMTLPLSMIILGIRLADIKFSSLFTDGKVYVACALKLVASPLMAFAVVFALVRLFPALDRSVAITIYIVMAMPSASLGLTFAEMFDGDRESAVRSTLLTTSALISGILMHDEGKCIHLFLVDQDVQLHQL